MKLGREGTKPGKTALPPQHRRPLGPAASHGEQSQMEIPSDDRYPVSEDHLRLERQERRFHREVNGTDYTSWRQLLRRISPDRRYRVTHFGMPTVLTGEEVLALAQATLVDRSCTYIGSVRQVGLEYEIPLVPFPFE